MFGGLGNRIMAKLKSGEKDVKELLKPKTAAKG